MWYSCSKTFVLAGSSSSWTPTSGLMKGGYPITVFGAGFSPSRYDYTCKFICGNFSASSSEVSPKTTSSIVCSLPSMSCEIDATVSIFKGNSERPGRSKFHLDSYWTEVLPTTGPNGGGTILEVDGLGFLSSVA